MSHIEQSIVINAPVERVFEVLEDFENYPEYQPEIIEIDVQKKNATHARVFLTVDIAGQKVDYTLEFKFKRGDGMSWKMVEGSSILKKNDGQWIFQKQGPKKTKAIFAADVDFAFWIPRSLAEGVIKSHLPKMLANIKRRAEKKK